MDGAALRAGRGRERGAPARAVLSASRGRAATRGLGLGQDDRAADLRWRESICSATCVLPNTASACAWLWARQWTRRFEGSPDTPRARATMSVDLEQRACRATFAQVADECALLAVAREHLAPRRAAPRRAAPRRARDVPRLAGPARLRRPRRLAEALLLQRFHEPADRRLDHGSEVTRRIHTTPAERIAPTHHRHKTQILHRELSNCRSSHLRFCRLTADPPRARHHRRRLAPRGVPSVA